MGNSFKVGQEKRALEDIGSDGLGGIFWAFGSRKNDYKLKFYLLCHAFAFQTLLRSLMKT